MRIPDLRLYLVTDTRLCGGPGGVAETARAAAAAGADIIQVRDHDASTRELTELTRAVMAAVDPFGTPVVVDDRLDVALAVGAAGVHLGQSDLDPADARRVASAVVGENFHIGWSTSNLDQVEAATRFSSGVVDLLGIGPFRATPTKPDAAAPLGLDGVAVVAAAAHRAGLPSVAIGGVTVDDVPALAAAGVNGVAVVSAICGQPDPTVATKALGAALIRAGLREGESA